MVHLADTKSAHQLIVRSILERVEPELILLVGSRAWGAVRDDSDYDLLLIMGDAADIEPKRRAAHEALRAHRIPADVFALAADVYARQQHDPGLIAYRASREGRVLYATGAIPQRSLRGGVREELPTEGLEMWIRRAESDLLDAENSFAAPRPAWDAICFHSHACVEKLLKALIVRTGTFPPRTHDLGDLLETQPPVIRDDPHVASACALLTALWPRSRYPELPEPTPGEARQAIAAARAVRLTLAPFLHHGDQDRSAAQSESQ